MTDRIKLIVGIAAGFLGLAAYVYLLGGLLMWLRLTAARLPADAAAGAFEDRRLLAMGLKALLFEIALLLVLLGFSWLLWKGTKWGDDWRQKHAAKTQKPLSEARGEQQAQQPDQLRAWVQALQTALGAFLIISALSLWSPEPDLENITLIALAVVWLGVLLVRPEWLLVRWQWIRWALTVLVAAFAILFVAAPLGVMVLVLLGLLQFSRRLILLPSAQHIRKLIPGVLITGSCLSVVIVAYLATPPVTFDRVVVVSNNGDVLLGGYIGRSDDGVFLATCKANRKDPETSGAAHMKVIPDGRIRRVIFGGYRYSIDHGKRPSLFNLAEFFVQRDRLEERLPRVEFDLRGRRTVCGYGTEPGSRLKSVGGRSGHQGQEQGQNSVEERAKPEAPPQTAPGSASSEAPGATAEKGKGR